MKFEHNNKPLSNDPLEVGRGRDSAQEVAGFTEEHDEEELRLNANDPLKKFVPIEEIPSDEKWQEYGEEQRSKELEEDDVPIIDLNTAEEKVGHDFGQELSDENMKNLADDPNFESEAKFWNLYENLDKESQVRIDNIFDRLDMMTPEELEKLDTDAYVAEFGSHGGIEEELRKIAKGRKVSRSITAEPHYQHGDTEYKQTRKDKNSDATKYKYKDKHSPVPEFSDTDPEQEKWEEAMEKQEAAELNEEKKINNLYDLNEEIEQEDYLKQA